MKAEELDKKFDENQEDILQYFDLSKAKKIKPKLEKKDGNLVKNKTEGGITIKPLEQIIIEKKNQYADYGAKQFGPAIKPIYGATNNGNPEHIGSCILISWKNKKYLVTAAHIIDNREFTNLYLALENGLKEISTDIYCTIKPDNDRKKDHYDFAWIEISKLNIANEEDIQTIDESNISNSKQLLSENIYLVLGYPNSKNKKHNNINEVLNPKYFKYTSTLESSKEWFIDKEIECGDHLLIKYHKKHAKNSSGNITNILSPKGMSGGAIIDMGKLGIEQMGNIKHIPKGKLVGMIIERSEEHNVLVAVKINTILAQIENQNLI